MSAVHLGFYNTSSTRTHVGFQFSTHAAAGGNVAPLSAFEAADLRIYRAADGGAYSATQRSSANGITMTSPFDSLVGVHDVDIDLTDNTDSGFYASGYRYMVMLAPDSETVDGQTITGIVLAYFEIGVSKADVTQFGGTAGTFASGIPEVKVASIAANAVTAAACAADFADEIWDEAIGDTTVTARQALKLFVAALGGKVSGAGTTTVTFRNAADSSNVIVATVDSSGNRSAVTLTL